MRLNRAEVVQDVVHVLLTAGVLFSLPVLTWVLGIY
jgi:Sec-independent protein secretion pathway component TatC